MFSTNKEKNSLLSPQENGRKEMHFNDRVKSTPLLYMPWYTKLDIYCLFLSQYSCRLYCYVHNYHLSETKILKIPMESHQISELIRTIISHLSICSVPESIKNLFNSNCFSRLAVNRFPDDAIGLGRSTDRWARCWHLHTAQACSGTRMCSTRDWKQRWWKLHARETD